MKSCIQVSLWLLAIQVGVVMTSAVTDLGINTFDGFINEHEVVMVEFYAPWCKVCEELAPIYEETALKLDLSQDIEFARVDCVAEAALCKWFSTPIYPTIRVFKGADVQELYNGPREPLDMIDFAQRRFRPAVALLTNAQSIEVFKRSNEVAVVAYWKPDDQKFKETFARVAKENLDYYSFGATDDVEAATAEGISQPTLVLYKHYDDTKVVYEGIFDADAITAFVDTVSIPLVGEFDRKWAGRYIYEEAPPLVGILAETAAGRGQLTELVSPIAKEYKGELRFATVDTTKSASMVSKFFKVEGQRSALIIVHQNRTFPIAEDIALTRDGVGAWVKDFHSGKLTPQDAIAGTAEESVNGRSVLDAWKKGGAQKDEL